MHPESLEMLQKELRKELVMVGEGRLPEIDRFSPSQIDVGALQKAEEFLRVLKRLYHNRHHRAEQNRKAILDALNEQYEDFNGWRNKYYNESISDIVRNVNTTDRIVQHKDRLIQKIYPIYSWPEPKSVFTFRTQFYVAHKPFFGSYMHTFYFNMMVIWMMTLLLYALLFYDILGRLFLPKK